MLVTRFLLPESVEILAKRGDFAAVRSLLSRTEPNRTFPADAEYVGPPEITGARVAALFRDGRALKTVAIRTILFCGVFNAYYSFSRLTTISMNSGVAESRALLDASAATLGGMIGALCLGSLIDRTRIGTGMTVIGPADRDRGDLAQQAGPPCRQSGVDRHRHASHTYVEHAASAEWPLARALIFLPLE